MLTYGEDMRIDDWQDVLEKVKREPGVVAAAPFVHDAGSGERAGTTYIGGGIHRRAFRRRRAACREVTTIRQHATAGDFRSRAPTGTARGIVLGKLMAARLNAFAGRHDHARVHRRARRSNAVTGQPVPSTMQFEVTGMFETGMYEYDNAYVYVALPVAQELARLGQWRDRASR